MNSGRFRRCRAITLVFYVVITSFVAVFADSAAEGSPVNAVASVSSGSQGWSIGRLVFLAAARLIQAILSQTFRRKCFK
jgi:hypothetical protein